MERKQTQRPDDQREAEPRTDALPAVERQDEPLKRHGDKLERAIARAEAGRQREG